MFFFLHLKVLYSAKFTQPYSSVSFTYFTLPSFTSFVCAKTHTFKNQVFMMSQRAIKGTKVQFTLLDVIFSGESKRGRSNKVLAGS